MNASDPLHVIILAAGQGTRMRSSTPKVMHKLAGFPLLEHALRCAHETGATSITVVLSRNLQPVEHAFKQAYPELQVVYQDSPQGTGHAVLAAEPVLGRARGVALVLFADTPLVRPQTLKNLVGTLTQEDHRAVAVLALEAPEHPHYGRVILEEGRPDRVARIVEMKNATPQEQAQSLCNAGLMAVRLPQLFELLAHVSPDAVSGELYLTDIIALARARVWQVGWQLADPCDVMGINTRQDLAKAEEILQGRLREKAFASGVTFLNPESVYLSLDTTFGQDVTLYPHLYFGPKVRVEDGVEIHSFSHLEGARIESGASIGPFARLRPGTHLKEKAKVGNFVELKQTTLGVGAKASHLSYLGDSQIGDGCNIGAGTITCNYDGHQKHITTLEDGVFVGSNATLIAPLHIGQGAYVAAGSVLTQNVSPQALALSRTPQKELIQGATRLKHRRTTSHTPKETS